MYFSLGQNGKFYAAVNDHDGDALRQKSLEVLADFLSRIVRQRPISSYDQNITVPKLKLADLERTDNLDCNFVHAVTMFT